MPPRSKLQPALSLFRVILPTWRFFEEASFSPTFSIRVQTGANSFGEWALCSELHPRRAWRLLFNARENFRMLNRELLVRAITEISDSIDSGSDFSQSLTYEMLRRMAARFAQNQLGAHNAKQQIGGARLKFQFKISDWEVATSDATTLAATDVLVSKEHTL